MLDTLRYIVLSRHEEEDMHRRSYSRHAAVSSRHHYCRWHHRGHGGPRARRGDIRAAALALLAERPMHGYEMIREIEDRTGGAWIPSAGSIYPALQLLEDEGLIKGSESEGRRRFELTEAGRKEQESRQDEAPWETVTAGYDPEFLRLRRSMLQLRASATQAVHAADGDQLRRIRELLDETRRRIYGILAESGEVGSETSDPARGR
jgi:DNA-binding PadR family transcriptional regulator